jgi:hypothetical protein
MSPHVSQHGRRGPRLSSPVEAHRFAMPVVREIGPAASFCGSSQRDLVVASLMLCDRDEPRRHRRSA